jgi:hypothetical protein
VCDYSLRVDEDETVLEAFDNGLGLALLENEPFDVHLVVILQTFLHQVELTRDRIQLGEPPVITATL